ncbi:MAG: helix-turn-helix transcriptional regulator [Chthoniobacterales bacterium]
MLCVEIPDDLLIRAVSDAVEKQLTRINDFSGYVDLKGACRFLSVSESQFKEWLRLGYIHPRKLSSHLVRYRLEELAAFMEEFLVKTRD